MALKSSIAATASVEPMQQHSAEQQGEAANRSEGKVGSELHAAYLAYRTAKNKRFAFKVLAGFSFASALGLVWFIYAFGVDPGTAAPLCGLALLLSSTYLIGYTQFGEKNVESIVATVCFLILLAWSISSPLWQLSDKELRYKDCVDQQQNHTNIVQAALMSSNVSAPTELLEVYHFYEKSFCDIKWGERILFDGVGFVTSWMILTMGFLRLFRPRFVHSLFMVVLPGMAQSAFAIYIGIRWQRKKTSLFDLVAMILPISIFFLVGTYKDDQMRFVIFKDLKAKDQSIMRGKTKIHAQNKEIEKVRADLKRLSNGSSLLDKLNARPPRAFAQIEFEELYASTDSFERGCLSSAALNACQEYLLVKPITDEKWVYFKTILVPLCLWDDRQVFGRLQQIAAESRSVITEEQNAIISALGNNNDSAAGSWLCCELEPIKADENIYEVAGNWLPPKYLTPVKNDTKEAKKEFDQTVLPESLRFHAGGEFDAFREALGRLLPPGTFFFEEPPLQPDENLLSSRAKARRMSSASLMSEGKSMIRCDRDKCVKKSARMKAKVTLALEEERAPYPCTATIGDSLRASIVAPNPEAMRMIWEHLASSEELRVIRMKNKFQTTFNELGADASSATFPDVHVNVMFGSSIVAEIQCHLREVIALKKESHKLYQITRAESIEALRPKSS